MLLTAKSSKSVGKRKKNQVKDVSEKKYREQIVEIKINLESKYYAVIQRVNELEGRPVELWLKEAIEAEVKALLDNYDELGKVLSDHLKCKYGLKECA